MIKSGECVVEKSPVFAADCMSGGNNNEGERVSYCSAAPEIWLCNQFNDTNIPPLVCRLHPVLL
jgi:hypothetical protein